MAANLMSLVVLGCGLVQWCDYHLHLRPREGKGLAQGHTASCKDFTPNSDFLPLLPALQEKKKGGEGREVQP